jgi:Transcriptional regulator
MARILKEPEVRKAEIMDAAEYLFENKGYEETSVNDILQRAGIAKGTFYYYFKSKDEILDAVIERNIEQQLQKLQPIIVDPGGDALEKFEQIMMMNQQMNQGNHDMLEFLHKPENIVMHQKSLIETVKKASPLFSELIRQGIRDNQFQTDYPQELSELLLVAMNFLFDPSIFSWCKDEFTSRMKALEDILETTLRAKPGSFHFLSEIIIQM